MMVFALGVTIALIASAGSTSPLGPRLEGIRRRTLSEHLARSGVTTPLDSGADLDDDEGSLDAYNRMLTQLSRQSENGTMA